MKELYCFDFDGTLTKKDSMFMFLRYYDSKKFYCAFLRFSILFLLVKMELISPDNIKKRFVASILKGEPKSAIEAAAKSFFSKVYPKIMRLEVMEYINQIDREWCTCVIVTASLDIWVKPFSDQLQMDLIATEALFIDDCYSGEFKTPNCTGKEKVNRLKQYLENKAFDRTIAWGDSKGDREMLAWADKCFVYPSHLPYNGMEMN